MPINILTNIRNTVRALADHGVPYELAVILVAQHLKSIGVPITKRNLEICFDI